MITKPGLTLKWLTCLVMCICSMPAKNFAQTNLVHGTVTDTLNRTPLHNAVIYLKSPKDSALVKYARADVQGNFDLPGVGNGKYILVVTYPNFVDWIDSVNVSAGNSISIPVYLTTRAHLLEEVIVKQTRAPIRIKGDTTVYMADSFHIKPGATVEDLLKILPGISVNSKGEITTQGQKVQKVLVDGDEFFGDDPTMATQNLNAHDVAQVEVFDRKSDQSTLTGIDDGSKQKTVNLVLKEDAKKGYFGKVDAGTDFNKYYQSKISANRFTSTLKAGGFITADRTGRNGMTWEEMQDYGSVTSSIENGDVSFRWEGDESFSSWGQQGIPENLQTGLMVNKKFGKLKSNTANNYTYNHLNLAGDGYTTTRYILPDTVYYNNQARSNKSSKWKQTLTSRNELNLDSATTLTINVKVSTGKTDQYTTQNGEYLTGGKVPVNKSRHTNYSSGDNNSQKADVFLKRKLNTTGTRFITLSAGMSSSNTATEGFLINETDFYSNGLPASQQVIDQRKLNDNATRTVQGLVSYQEPVSKKISFNLNYTFNTSNSEQDTRSYEKKNGKYDSLNLLYSNHFRFINTSSRGGFALNYATKKITMRAGLAIQDLKLRQTNLYKDSSYARNFTNFFPNANLRWKFSASGNLSLNYSGSTQQPSLMQIQPILNNTDPLNLTIGNAELKPAFHHSVYFNLSDFKVLTNRSIWGYGNLTFSQNDFSNKSVVDAQGRRTTQAVNVNGNYRYYTGFSFSRQLKIMKLEISFDPGFSGNRKVSFVNGLENVTNSYMIQSGISLRKSIEKKLYLNISYRPEFNHSESSINTGAVTEYWSQSISSYADVKLGKGWNVNTDFRANFRQKLSAGDRNNNELIWNASVEKRVSKKKDITAILTINDILDRRIGFSRDITSNYVSEDTYTTIQRYAMLSLRWKFSKNRKNTDNDD